MTQELITIDQLINRAKNNGVDFGKGSAKIHVGYLSSLGLLPKAARKKVDGKLTGCYPKDSVEKLLTIEQLKNEGLTYSQIQIRLETENNNNSFKPSEAIKAYLGNSVSALSRNNSFANLAFLIIGLALGYLVAFTGLQKQPGSLSKAGSNETFSTIAVSHLDDSSPEMLRLMNIKSDGKSDSQPIYIITVPKQNLDKMGKTTDLSLLNN